jgi:C_GCAxxG_C_C family probable redox protein
MTTDREAAAARAEGLFIEGYSCSQAVLLAFAARLGMEPGVAARVASSFGGGMARHGWTCGALTGALMAVGLHAGNASAAEEPQKLDAYARVATLVERFRTEHGATDCRALIGFDLADPVQREAARQAGVFRQRCPLYVRTAAGLVDEALDAPRVG